MIGNKQTKKSVKKKNSRNIKNKCIHSYLFTETLKQVSNIPSHFLQESIFVCGLLWGALQELDGLFGGLQLLLDLLKAPGIGIVPMAHEAQPGTQGSQREIYH